MIEFLKNNINHDILFILTALAITIGYIGSFIIITTYFALRIGEKGVSK